jgi:hypothetical protein
MKREIFEVVVKIVDANGNYNTLSGYPKSFDSKNYDNEIEKAQSRAYGEYHAVLGELYKRDDRQLQVAYVFCPSSGILTMTKIGSIADLPDPEPEEETEPEQTT